MRFLGRLCVVGLAAVLLAAASATSPSASNATGRSVPDVASAGPGESASKSLATAPGKAAWADRYADAKARAERENKVIFVEFTEHQCGNCSRMDALLYPAVNFEMMLLRMVPVRLDRASPEGSTLAQRYGITETPAVLIVSSGGALIFRVNGFDSPGPFYAHVGQSMSEWDTLHVKMIHEPEFRNDPKEELALGTSLALRFDPEEAAPRFAQAASNERADPATREKALTYLASAQFKTRKYADSRASLEKLLRVSKDADLREQAELFLGEIAFAEGHAEDARKMIRTFLHEHPESRRRTEAEKILEKIRGDR